MHPKSLCTVVDGQEVVRICHGSMCWRSCCIVNAVRIGKILSWQKCFDLAECYRNFIEVSSILGLSGLGKALVVLENTEHGHSHLCILPLFSPDRLSAILPEDTRQQLFNLLPKRDFEIAYRLDCRNLCADFREDIEFRFSFGPTALLQKLLGSKGSAGLLMGTAGSVSC